VGTNVYVCAQKNQVKKFAKKAYFFVKASDNVYELNQTAV